MASQTKKVTIYSTPTCHFCQMTKEFFKENNIEYTDHNVAEDAQARQEMLEKSGQMGVPFILISWEEGGETKHEGIVGFNKPQLEKTLGIAS